MLLLLVAVACSCVCLPVAAILTGALSHASRCKKFLSSRDECVRRCHHQGMSVHVQRFQQFAYTVLLFIPAYSGQRSVFYTFIAIFRMFHFVVNHFGLTQRKAEHKYRGEK